MTDPLDPKRHASPLRFFLATNSREVPWIALCSIFYGAGASTGIGVSYLLGKVVDALNSGHGSVFRFLVYILILVAGYEIFYRLGHICEIGIKIRIRAATKHALFDHTSSLSFGYFTDRFAGEIAHKVATVADALERLTNISINYFAENGFLIIVSAALLGIVHPAYAAFLAGMGLAFGLILMALSVKMSYYAGAYAEEEAKTAGRFVDLYANVSAVKVYGRADNRSAVHRQIETEKRALRALGFWDVVMYNCGGVFLFLLCAGLVAISSYLYMHALLSVGQIVFVMGVGFRIYGMVWELGPRFVEFIRYRGEATQNLADLVVAPAIVDGAYVPRSARELADVEYKKVSFGYSAQSILSDFSLLIRPGEKLGVVGLSGAGKTTFANLLLRFFDVQSGAILLNGTDIREFTQEYLRSHISYISQDTSLFHASIAENIAYGSHAASQADIERAATLAYSHEFIELLPKKYESIVGERGIKLSGGQRQRIAVARAILADRPLFLLDEATSALDSDSEKKIQKALTTLMEGKTVIAIAHRLSTLSHMDRIIYLEDGKILEDGTHDELLKLNGKYAQLWHLQAGGFLPDTI